MNRGKIVAIITGVISILLAVAYLLIVQILDFRGEMKPAPMSLIKTHFLVVTIDAQHHKQVDNSLLSTALFIQDKNYSFSAIYKK